jgi:hypothetical protein
MSIFNKRFKPTTNTGHFWFQIGLVFKAQWSGFCIVFNYSGERVTYAGFGVAFCGLGFVGR